MNEKRSFLNWVNEKGFTCDQFGVWVESRLQQLDHIVSADNMKVQRHYEDTRSIGALPSPTSSLASSFTPFGRPGRVTHAIFKQIYKFRSETRNYAF